jgi:aminoglycoside 6-adenylyltransferase
MTGKSCKFDPPDPESVLEHLVRWADERADVRAVILTSTRTDQDVHTDPFSDFDVILAVPDVTPFFGSRTWLSEFGEVLVLYRDPVRTREGGESFAYITQYADGLKMDFTIAATGVIEAIAAASAAGGGLPDDLDVGYTVLLDKDRLTDGLTPPTRTAFVPARPSEEEFATLVEVFFHEATYVAKHLWRGDLMPAKYCFDHVMKQQKLRTALEWLVETEHDWSLPTRAYGKGLQDLLPPDVWAALENTYVGAGTEDNWDALFATVELFRDVATTVAARLGYEYSRAIDGRTCRYLASVRDLPVRPHETGGAR